MKHAGTNGNDSTDSSNWQFSKYRQLKPGYPETRAILQFLLTIANGNSSIHPACDEWLPVIPLVEAVIARDKRPNERDDATTLIEKIRDLCPDRSKHQIKHFLK